MTRIRVLLKFYIMFFAVPLLGMNLLSIIEPGYAKSEPPYPDRLEQFATAIPFIIYAIFVLLSTRRIRNSRLFYLTTFFLFAGAFYFLSTDITFILRKDWNITQILFFFGTTGLVRVIPAIGAIILLLWNRKLVTTSSSGPSPPLGVEAEGADAGAGPKR